MQTTISYMMRQFVTIQYIINPIANPKDKEETEGMNRNEQQLGKSIKIKYLGHYEWKKDSMKKSCGHRYKLRLEKRKEQILE